MSLLYELKNIEHFYEGKKVLNIDNLTLYKNQIVGFFGPNGSGKSTLFSLLSFICKPTKGEVFLENNNKIDSLIKKDIVMLPQNPYLLKRSVFENIAYAMEVIGEKPRNIKKRVMEVLDLVGLKHKIRSFPNELSGGEQQRIAIARAIVNNPKVLIADEPTGNLDPENSWEIMNLLERINLQGTTILMATHNSQIVNTLRHRVIAIEDGHVVRDEVEGAYGYDE